MGIKKVTLKGVQKSNDAGTYKRGGNPFEVGFKMLKLKPGEKYKIRVLPPNNDEKTFKEDYHSFAFCLQNHYGVGSNGKESVPCPSHIAPKFMVKCPGCRQFKEGSGEDRAKLKFTYYINCVVLSRHEGLENTDKTGKLIVYTVRIPKTQVYDKIAEYLAEEDRGVEDPMDLEAGCAIKINVTKKNVGAATFPQYDTTVMEASTGDLSKKIRVEDIKDLRLIGMWLPSTRAMEAIYDGMPCKDALECFGKINAVTGERIEGSVVATDEKEAEDDLDSEDGEDMEMSLDDLGMDSDEDLTDDDGDDLPL